nr:fimbria/pilus outer membrane usher protein [uncultured Enterobacter sp.]
MYRLTPRAIFLLLIADLSTARADDYFSPDFIEMQGNIPRDIDISRFSQRNGQAPGMYHVDVYLNGQFVEARDIPFASGDHGLTPTLTRDDVIKWGVKPNAQPAWMALAGNATVVDLGTLLPGSQTEFEFDGMRLNVSVPQEYLARNPQGAVSPAQWDDGLNMLFMNYAFSAADSQDHGNGRTDSYLNLRSGINVGPWRVRNYSTWNHTDQGNRWNSLSTSLERDIKALKSQFSAGDSYTPSGVFDSVNLRGLQLWSDDAMLPESQRGFAPVVRGIARSNAQVTIRQGGNIIWQSYVPPGPFVIDDLYPTAASGDLEVSVREADGTLHQFVQPFSAVPIMQREGQLKYAFAAGEYRATSSKDKTPEFMLATLGYGLPWESTLYGGTLISADYLSGAIGIGKGFGDFGSLSFDSTFARTQLPGGRDEGLSFRAQYAKDLALTGTAFTLMGYRYSTSGFRDFQEANGDVNAHRQGLNDVPDDNAWRYLRNKRSKAQMNINQRLGDWGNLNLSAWQQSYWGGSTERSLNLGFNTSINGINYGLNYSDSRGPWHSGNDRIVSLMVQIPLSRFLPNSWMNLSGNVNRNGDTASQVGMSGSALADRNLSWNVQQGYDSRGTGVTGNASMDYKARYGEYQMSYSTARDARQLSLGAMGGVVVHPYGVALTQPLGETMALVKADNAAGVSVANNAGIYTDAKGFAVVPYVTPYRQNHLTLDTATLGKNTDLQSDTRTVIPTKGALALADYPTVTGYKLMLTLTGSDVPFGATASINDRDHAQEGIVDDRKRVWLSGAPQAGTVTVRWAGGECTASWRITQPSDNVHTLTAPCR